MYLKKVEKVIHFLQHHHITTFLLFFCERSRLQKSNYNIKPKIFLQFYLNKMSDFQQMSEIPMVGLPKIDQNTLIESFSKDFPAFKDILTCPPEQIIPKISQLAQFPEEQRKPLRKYSTLEHMKAGDLLLEQLQRVIGWDISHLELFYNLMKILPGLWLDLDKIYKTFLLMKVDNGLHFVEILEKLLEVPSKGFHDRPYESLEKHSLVSKELKNSFEVTKTERFKEDPDFAIYNKRFNCLNKEEKLKYQVKLIQQIIGTPQPRRRGPGFGPRAFEAKEELNSDIDKMYEKLDSTDYLWFLEELLKIRCPKTAQYKRIIFSLKLVESKSEEGKIALEENPKIKPKLLTQSILKSCLNDERETEAHLFSDGNTYDLNGQLYLKYDISTLEEVTINQIGSLRVLRQMSIIPGQQNVNQAKCRQRFLAIANQINSIIRNIVEGKGIFVYDADHFIEISREKSAEILLFCMKMTEKMVEMGKMLKLNNIIAEILINPDLITNFNLILGFLVDKEQEKAEEIFLIMCSVLEDLVVKSQQKMVIMNNAEFFDNFAKNTNKILASQKTKLLPQRLESFLVNYVTKFFEYGMDIERLNLEKIYELKLNNLGKEGHRSEPEMFRFMHMNMMRNRQDLERLRGSAFRSKFQDFIEVFPRSIGYFNEKLLGSIGDIAKELAEVDIFDNQKCPDKFKYLLKLFSNEKMANNEQLNQQMKNVINTHPSIFTNNSQGINWNMLKIKLQISDEEINQAVLSTINEFRTNFAFENVEPHELCEQITSSDKKLTEQVNLINRLNLLLKMRTKSPTCPYVRQVLEISLFMEKVESVSLNKIVKHQAAYSEEKLQEIKALYREFADKQNILYFKLVDISSKLSITCWEVIADLDVKHINIFLKEYHVYFEAMKDVDDKNLILRLLKKTYRSISQINISKNYNFSFQLYNHNRTIINEVLRILFTEVSTVTPSRDAVVMGDSYLRFIDKCRLAKKDPAAEFSIIIRPHIESSLREFLDFLFFRIDMNVSIFNNKSYSGDENNLKIVRALMCDSMNYISSNFNSSSASYCYRFINIIYSKGLRPFPGVAEVQTLLQIEQPSEPLQLVTKQEKDKRISQSYIKILGQLFQMRYNKAQINDIQNLFFIIVDKLNEKYKIPRQQRPLLSTILKEMSQRPENAEIDEGIFKIQCSWIGSLLKKVKDFKIEEVISSEFVRSYLKLTTFMLNNPEQYKDSLKNSLNILEKFIPRNFAENREKLINYTHGLLQIIIKIINISIFDEKLNSEDGSQQKIDTQSIKTITEIVIKTKCTEFNQQIRSLLSILLRCNTGFGVLLCELIEKQTHLASMEADIKGLFLRQSENLVDEQQEKISIRLETFINIFKEKYEQDVLAFSNLTSKFVKKNIKIVDKKETVYLSYEKSNSFSYSQVFKKNFAQYEPSDYIKIIIRDMLSFKDNEKLPYILISLRDLFFYSPLIIPYVMLHPIQTNNGEIAFIDYLVSEVSKKQSKLVNLFLLLVCLDHSCLIKQGDRTIFFSEYMCYRIIKSIANIGINKFTLFLTYHLSQLKRFNYLCKIKLNKSSNKSLVNLMIDHLKASRDGFEYKNGDNNLVYLILAYVTKQDQIDNLKKCFIPKQPKEHVRRYRLIDECLIPFNVFYRKRKAEGLEAREDNISFTGNLVTPFYFEDNETLYLDEEYQFQLNYLIPREVQREVVQFSCETVEEMHIKALSSVNNPRKYKNTDSELLTPNNQKIKEMISKIESLYFKPDQVQASKVKRPARFNRIDGRPERLANRQQEQMFGRYIGNAEMIGPMGNMRPFGRGRGGRGNGRHMNSRNQAQLSRYAAQDYFTDSPTQAKEKNIQTEFQQSLSVIPSEQAIKQDNSMTNFEDVKTTQEELTHLIKYINDKLFLINKEPLNEAELNGKSFLQKKQFLEQKEAQLDFDYNKIWLTADEFQEYLLMNSVRFSKLDETRRQQVRQAEQIMYALNLVRSPSSDSINYIIDTIDENYQHIPNINRTLSRNSLSSDNESIGQNLTEDFYFQSTMLPLRAFSDIHEDTIYQMLLSFYYECENIASKQFMPFLENKKIQNRLVNTLLHLMRNPFNTPNFPSCCFKFNEKELNWKKTEINQNNQEYETNHFIERILPIFQSVKNYSFYQNDRFLLDQISNQGFFGIVFEASSLNKETNTYIPINQLLEISFKASVKLTLQLLKGVSSLSEPLIDKLIQIIMKNEFSESEGENIFEMGRVHQRQGRRGRSTTFFGNLKELYKNQSFKAKFKIQYPFGVKDPKPALLVHLIQSGIYSSEQLKTMQLKMLANKQEDPDTLVFLNKVIQVYTDQELKQAKWLKQYRQIIAKSIEYLNMTGAKINNQPIVRILNATNDLGFEIKRVLFEKEMNEKRHQINYDYNQLQRTSVLARKKKGIFESAFEDLRYKPDNFWLSPFSVKFINENGNPESGFGDGVRREWFTFLTKGMVNLNYALFKRTPTNYYFFNKESYLNPRHLQYFEFIGKLFGLSLTKNSLMVSPSFSILLYKMILSEEITLKDILTEFEQERQQIEGLERMIESAKSVQDTTWWDFDFTYLDKRLISSVNYSILANKKIQGQDQIIGKRVDITCPTTEDVIKELHSEEEQKNLPHSTKVVKVTDILEIKPGGADIKVTFENMHEYLELTKKKIYQLVVDQVKKQFQAFMAGFKRVVNPKMLARFNANQLRLLVERISEISIEDIQRFTRNSDVDEITASLLWSTLQGLSNEDRSLFLWNWTGVDKLAAEGAKIMGLSINASRGKYFIAHTCPKSLEVPKCLSKEEMEMSVTIVLNNVKTGRAIIED